MVLMMGLLALAGCSSDNTSKMLEYDLLANIEDVNGDPAAGAEVKIEGEQVTLTETADANGLVIFEDLISDTYKVTADYSLNDVLYRGKGTATISGSDITSVIQCDEKLPQPSSAPIEPSSVDVGLFTDASADTSIIMNGADWSAGKESNIDFNGNTIKKHSTEFVGYNLSSSLDASSKSTLHLQVWTAGHSAIKIKFVDFGGTGSDYDKDNDDDTEYEYLVSISSTESWVQLDISLAEWSEIMNISDINQIIFTGVDENNTGVKNYYIDNIYID